MPNDAFLTADLPTASFLLCHRTVSFVGFASKDPKSKYFMFSPPDEAKRLAFAFISGRAKVVAKHYADAMRTAKDLLFSKANIGNGYGNSSFPDRTQ